VSGKLVVLDTSNNRVLIWNAIPTASGTPADVVLGQKDFTHCLANDETGTGAPIAPTAKTLALPVDAASDGTRLFVVDFGNHRVLVWNAIPTTSQTPADYVLGQSALTTNVSAGGRYGLAQPACLSSNGNQLLVTDSGNNRVLGWNQVPTTSGVGPDFVLGQSDFAHVTANDDSQVNVVGPNPTARTVWRPFGVSILDDRIMVTDQNNSRHLVYMSQ
jgi:hypothetical protein